MRIAQAARVRIVKVAMWKFSSQNPFCSLPQGSFIVRNPASQHTVPPTQRPLTIQTAINSSHQARFRREAGGLFLRRR